MKSNSVSIQTKRRLQKSYITTTISIALVLLLLSIIGLLLLNARRLTNYVKENIGFSITIKDSVKDADKKWLQKELLTTKFVKSAELITKEKAAEELKEQLGEDFVGFLGYNPLLATIDIRLKAEYANIDSINSLKTELLSYQQVKEVYYQESLVHLVTKNVNRISIVIAVFSFLLLMIAFALISNTIRLSVYSNRFSIKTMQLVGATDAFIRKPFLLRSLLYGLTGATIALIIVYIMIYLLHSQFKDVITIANVGVLSILIMILGMALSWVSTFIAVNKYLSLNIDQLYF